MLIKKNECKVYFVGLLICKFYLQIRSVIINQLFVYKTNLTTPSYTLFLLLSSSSSLSLIVWAAGGLEDV